jgi:hypothetical protein
MDWIQAIILGIVQGLTEFLPVSSSGHLVLAQHILGVNEAGVLLEVILHMGTLAAILLYFYGDLKQLVVDFFNGSQDARNYVIYLAIATIPAVCTGLILKDIIESTFTISIVKWMFMITGIIVGSTYFSKNRPKREMVLIIAFCIGFAQSFALLPGISRSGITISLALIVGIQHKEAAKDMVIPEREIPGSKANDCANPIQNAIINTISLLGLFLEKYVEPTIIPVIMNIHFTMDIVKVDSIISLRINPVQTAGIVAIARYIT